MSFLPYACGSGGGWVAAFGGSALAHLAMVAGLVAALQADRGDRADIELAGLPPVIIEDFVLDDTALVEPPEPDPVLPPESEITPPEDPTPPDTVDVPPPPEEVAAPPPETEPTPPEPAATPAEEEVAALDPVPDASVPEAGPTPPGPAQILEPLPEPLPKAEEPPEVDPAAQTIPDRAEDEAEVVRPAPVPAGERAPEAVTPAPPEAAPADGSGAAGSEAAQAAAAGPDGSADPLAGADPGAALPEARAAAAAPLATATLQPIAPPQGGVLALIDEGGAASLDGPGGGPVHILAPVGNGPTSVAASPGGDAAALGTVTPEPGAPGTTAAPARIAAAPADPGGEVVVAALPGGPTAAPAALGGSVAAPAAPSGAPQAVAAPPPAAGAGSDTGAAPPLSQQDRALLDLIVAVSEIQRDRRCVVALPRRLAGDQVGLLMAAAEEAAMSDFLADMTRLFPDFVPTQIQRVLVDGRQCAALDFVSANADYPGARLGLQVQDRVLNSGEVLRGFVVGDAALDRAVVIVDDNGVLHDLSRFQREVPEVADATRFDAPLTRRSGTRETRLLLIALAAPDGLEALRQQDGRLAAEVFPTLEPALRRGALLATTLIELR